MQEKYVFRHEIVNENDKKGNTAKIDTIYLVYIDLTIKTTMPDVKKKEKMSLNRHSSY